MQTPTTHVIRSWPYFWPPIAFVVLLASLVFHPTNAFVALALTVVLIGVVLSAVEHAEVVAHRVGEPFGSLILALAVTVIEVGMIVMLMLSDTSGATTLARDTVFSATILTTNMIIGLSLVISAGRGGLAYFNEAGAATEFSAVFVLATGTMVIPEMTKSAPEGIFSTSQLIFAALVAFMVWVAFVITQTRGHRDFFLPVKKHGEVITQTEHATRPSNRRALVSLLLLLLSLFSVVGLSEILSHPLEAAVKALGMPYAMVGVMISLIVLMPETLSAINNARNGRTQIALNLGYGSALASIGLTIPTVGMISLIRGMPLVLGLEPIHLALLTMTGILSILTISQGKAMRLQGAMHLVVAASYIFLVAVP
ncbi:MAG: hypothetical protein SPI12_04100 [Actinomycetaceae bacterium]|nr:hypothetical protein [Actinomycetaceae bacterium]MDY6083028.1 hypothetical protein [Actinomycetaceae bacterium]